CHGRCRAPGPRQLRGRIPDFGGHLAGEYRPDHRRRDRYPGLDVLRHRAGAARLPRPQPPSLANTRSAETRGAGAGPHDGAAAVAGPVPAAGAQYHRRAAGTHRAVDANRYRNRGCERAQRRGAWRSHAGARAHKREAAMSFTPAQWTALWPLVVLALTAVVAMVGIAIHRNHKATLIITLAGLAASIWLLWPAAGVASTDVTPLLRLDGFALLFIGLIAGAAFVVALLAYDYLETLPTRREEFYVLLLTATLGASALAASNHFVSFFLGLELLSVSLYGLNAYPHGRPLPLEAGIKYLVLASSSAAFLLFGMALLYAATGTMNFSQLEATLAGAPATLVLPGAVLVLVGIGFKLGLVPFHLWTPDVYQGAPAPVTAFTATASKAGVFAVLLRFLYRMGQPPPERLMLVLTILAIASMVAGNLLALRQNNVKRLLAYSSIAHMGYILVALEAAGASRTMA